MELFFRLRWVVLALALAACATGKDAASAADFYWTGHGYLSPGASGEPEIIGTFATEAECREAVDYWMSRQVVGNPVSGECLPTDRR
ncbi:MAG: hypothetical protein HXY21_14365 [Parvularculaceae bacterium]|nr:hypothetical protein [Parvularculaceae bacterium]